MSTRRCENISRPLEPLDAMAWRNCGTHASRKLNRADGKSRVTWAGPKPMMCIICPSVPLSFVLQCDRGRDVIVTRQTQDDDFGLVGNCSERMRQPFGLRERIEPPMEVDHSVEFRRIHRARLWRWRPFAPSRFEGVRLSDPHDDRGFFQFCHSPHGGPPSSGCQTLKDIVLYKATSKNRRFPSPCKSDSKLSRSERGRLAWDSLASSI